MDDLEPQTQNSTLFQWILTANLKYLSISTNTSHGPGTAVRATQGTEGTSWCVFEQFLATGIGLSNPGWLTSSLSVNKGFKHQTLEIQVDIAEYGWLIVDHS